jgi:hypothetical protein
VYFNQFSRSIINADHSIMRSAVMRHVLELPPQNSEVGKKKANADQSKANASRKLDAE